MAGQASYSAKWSVEDGAAPTFTGSSVRWDFKSDAVKRRQQRLVSRGLRGTRTQITAQTRFGVAEVGGSLSIDPSPKFLGWALPRVMGGGTETAPAFGDLVTTFGLLADRGSGGNGNCSRFDGLKISRLALSGTAGGLIDCTIDLFGKTRTRGQTFAGAALGTSLAYAPYAHADVAFIYDTVGAAHAVKLTQWNFTIDNFLRPRWINAIDADEILETNSRLVSFSGLATMSAADVDTDLLTAVKDGVAATFTLTNGAVSTAFSFAAIQADQDEEQINADEFLIPISAQIRGTTASEMTVTNDVTV